MADLFNRQHEAKFSEDQCGHGGRIREKRVATLLEERGSVPMQGRLGVRPSPHLALSALPASVGAATGNSPFTSTHARATPLLPATHYACEATVNITVPTTFEIENYNRRECREALGEISWSQHGPLDDLRRRLLEYYKLKRIKKKTKTTPPDMPERATNRR